MISKLKIRFKKEIKKRKIRGEKTYQKLNPALVAIVISRFFPVKMRWREKRKAKTKWRQLID